MGIDAFATHIDAAKNTQRLPLCEEVVTKEVWVVHLRIPVQAERGPFSPVLVESVNQGGPVQSVVQRLFHITKITPAPTWGHRAHESGKVSVWNMALKRIISRGYVFRNCDSTFNENVGILPAHSGQGQL